MTIQFLNHIIFSYMPALFVDDLLVPGHLAGPLEPNAALECQNCAGVQAARPCFVMVK